MERSTIRLWQVEERQMINDMVVKYGTRYWWGGWQYSGSVKCLGDRIMWENVRTWRKLNEHAFNNQEHNTIQLNLYAQMKQYRKETLIQHSFANYKMLKKNFIYWINESHIFMNCKVVIISFVFTNGTQVAQVPKHRIQSSTWDSRVAPK